MTRWLALTAALACVLAVVPGEAAAKAAIPTSRADISYHSWTSDTDFAAGTAEGTTASGGALGFGAAAGTLTYSDPYGYPAHAYEYARWTSPRYATPFAFTELVSSWTADTPAGSWVQVEMHGRGDTGADSAWYVMGRWAWGDGDIHRTSVNGQSDALGSISTDTWFAARGHALGDYQLRVTLYRLPGTTGPTVRSVGAVASALPSDKSVTTSPLGGAEGIELAVPRYSQDIHTGQYPQYDGGGEAWCSPTSTEMITEFWGARPTSSQLSWVDPSYADPTVDFAARGAYDYAYNGTGNWPFNIGYAAGYGLEGQVVQLRSLNEAEQFIKAGIPLALSVSFKSSELDGAGYSTSGHLMVLVGFTASGDAIVNDPASPSDSAVRHVYKRGQLENVWVPTTRSGGVAYVIHAAGTALPPNVANQPANW
ncbi:MAG: C39 family peptidase [Mycobacteriales bacterium]